MCGLYVTCVWPDEADLCVAGEVTTIGSPSSSACCSWIVSDELEQRRSRRPLACGTPAGEGRQGQVSQGGWSLKLSWREAGPVRGAPVTWDEAELSERAAQSWRFR